MLQFTVFGTPIAQGRPRATSMGGHIHMYDPKASRDYKQYVRLAAAEHKPKVPYEGPLEITVKVFRPIPKSFSQKRAKIAESGGLRPITKPDADNYVKLIKDALKSVIWKDDAQVVDMHVSKFYSDNPRIEVTVKEA
jgi:Holliday junction resolvase RusA-like endonuclease